MTRRLAFALMILAVAVLSGCGGTRVPDWTTDGYNNLEAFKERYLAGRSGAAEANWRHTVEAIRMKIGRAHV